MRPAIPAAVFVIGKLKKLIGRGTPAAPTSAYGIPAAELQGMRGMSMQQILRRSLPPDTSDPFSGTFTNEDHNGFTRSGPTQAEARGGSLGAAQTLLPTLRRYARRTALDSDLSKSALRNIVGLAIGEHGLTPALSPRIPPAVREQIIDAWHEWSCETGAAAPCRNGLNMRELQQAVLYSVLRDGDAFVIRRFWRGRPALWPLESDALAEYNLGSLQYYPNRDRKQLGIRLDEWGLPRQYVIAPGGQEALNWYDTDSSYTALGGEERAINAEHVMHVRFVLSIHTIRGLPIFAGTVRKLITLDEYDEAMLDSLKRVARTICAIRVTDPIWASAYQQTDSGIETFAAADEVVQTMASNPDRLKRPLQRFAHAAAIELQPGEDIAGIPTNAAIQDTVKHREDQAREASAGLGMSHHALIGDFTGQNYAGARQAANIDYTYATRLRAMLADKLLTPTWRWWMMAKMADGAIPMMDDKTYQLARRPEWIGPPQWLMDPTKETQAKLARVDAGVEPIHHLIKPPYTAEDIALINAQHKQAMEKNGLTMNTGAVDKSNKPEEEDTDDDKELAKNNNTE